MTSRKNKILWLLAASTLLAGCKSIAVRAAADAVSATGDTYGRDDDPELVRAAVPFGLKTMESIHAEAPDHEELNRALASGFTQYGYAFVLQDADLAELAGRSSEARAGRDRARKLFLRARDYGLEGLDQQYPGLRAALLSARDLQGPLARVKKQHVPMLYWTAAAWALAISSGKGDMALVAELPAPVAMMNRALELDESWDDGAIHEFFVTYDGGRSEADGGGPAKARAHLDRALQLSGGKKLGPLVAYAEAVLVQSQDRAEFERILRQVLASDPGAEPRYRLANLLAQRRAQALLGHVDDLFA